MKKRWWLVFAGCAAAVVAAMSWETLRVLELEAAENRAWDEAARQEAVRLALWRMEGRLGPWLATEAARPYFEYSAYYPLERPYDALLEPVRAGEILAKSPLLTFASPLVSLHFQMNAAGVVTSPQVPQANQLALALTTCIGPDRADDKALHLDELARSLDEQVLRRVASAGAASLLPGQAAPGPALTANSSEQVLLNQREFGKRSQSYVDVQTQNAAVGDGPSGQRISVGAFAPLWFGVAEEQLLFVREVQRGQTPLLQGFVVNWPALSAEMLGEVEDLFPSAALSALSTLDCGVPSQGLALAGVPAQLVPGELSAALLVARPLNARWSLLATWAAVLGALLTVAWSLRAALVLGERRVRFASAVTHELRTPLTTFRLYTDMLADDMISDPGQRREYLQTLRDESERLSGLVENVLAFARIEEGHSLSRREDTTVGELLTAVGPVLERRAEEAQMSLVVDAHECTELLLKTDATVVGQVLFNLVDNAAKYAADGANRRIHLHAASQDGSAGLSIRDHGPGVTKSGAKLLFKPFEREEHSAQPGVGLGLSLSRALARDLGGDLVFEPATEGCCFRLVLPAG